MLEYTHPYDINMLSSVNIQYFLILSYKITSCKLSLSQTEDLNAILL